MSPDTPENAIALAVTVSFSWQMVLQMPPLHLPISVWRFTCLEPICQKDFFTFSGHLEWLKKCFHYRFYTVALHFRITCITKTKSNWTQYTCECRGRLRHFSSLLNSLCSHAYTANDDFHKGRTHFSWLHMLAWFRVCPLHVVSVRHSVAIWLIFLGSDVDYVVWQGIKDHAVKGFYKLSEVRCLQRGYAIKSSFSFTSSSPSPCKRIR